MSWTLPCLISSILSVFFTILKYSKKSLCRLKHSRSNHSKCFLSIIMSISPLLEMSYALEWSLCGGSGLRLWLYSLESGGHCWAGWGTASSGRHKHTGEGTFGLSRKGYIKYSSDILNYLNNLKLKRLYNFTGFKETWTWPRSVMSVSFEPTTLAPTNKAPNGHHTSNVCLLCKHDSIE